MVDPIGVNNKKKMLSNISGSPKEISKKLSIRSISSTPILVMPKPKHGMPPTMALLRNSNHEKTLREQDEILSFDSTSSTYETSKGNSSNPSLSVDFSFSSYSEMKRQSSEKILKENNKILAKRQESNNQDTLPPIDVHGVVHALQKQMEKMALKKDLIELRRTLETMEQQRALDREELLSRVMEQKKAERHILEQMSIMQQQLKGVLSEKRNPVREENRHKMDISRETPLISYQNPIARESHFAECTSDRSRTSSLRSAKSFQSDNSMSQPKERIKYRSLPDHLRVAYGARPLEHSPIPFFPMDQNVCCYPSCFYRNTRLFDELGQKLIPLRRKIKSKRMYGQVDYLLDDQGTFRNDILGDGYVPVRKQSMKRYPESLSNQLHM